MNVRSFATKHQWVLMTAGIFLTAALVVMLYYGRIYVQQMAMDRAVQALKDIVNSSFKMIQRIESGADSMVPLIESHLDDPDLMFTYSQKILKENPDIKGCSISFEPNFFQEKGTFFSAYSYSGGDSIITEQEGDINYQYFYMDWYLIPRQLNKPYWIEPFSEPDIDGIIVKEIMTSYCQPLHDSQGNTIGVLSADVPLEWLSDVILSHHPFPKSYCMLIGRGGTYIVHPDSSRLLYETILTPTLVADYPDLSQLGRAMISGQTGSQSMVVDGVDTHVFYMPFGRTGWSLALVCPESMLMYKYYLFAALMLLLILGSGIMMTTPLWLRQLKSRKS